MQPISVLCIRVIVGMKVIIEMQKLQDKLKPCPGHYNCKCRGPIKYIGKEGLWISPIIKITPIDFFISGSITGVHFPE